LLGDQPLLRCAVLLFRTPQGARAGGDRRGIGLLFEVENEGLKRIFPEARWMPTDFLCIGENQRGDHVRVHHFPDVPAPEPDQGNT
jgi:hypothetical protein